MFRKRIGVALLPLFFSVQLGAYNLPPFALLTNDVVAFVGGSDVAAAQFTGHLEALLAVKFPLARYRNFGWEGDTVFAQPRDVGFPPLAEHLKRAEVSVIFLQYGRAEALDSKHAQTNFEAAYEKLIAACNRRGIPAGIHCSGAAGALTAVRRGFRLITVTSDVVSMTAFARSVVGDVRKGLQG